MQLMDLFYKWVPLYIRLPVLLLLFFVILTANGVFLGNTTDMYSSLGVYTEPYTQAYNAMYIGMGLGLMAEIRMKMRFSNKTLLLFGLISMLGMNIICATTANPTLVVLACFLLGFTKVFALVEVYVIWMFVWTKQADSTRFYPFVYFIALSGLYLVTWWTTRLAFTYNWHYAYIWIIILLLTCIGCALIFVENHPLRRPLPLYRMDWIGLILLATSLMLIDYIAVYGKVEDWFQSKKIQAALLGWSISLLLFISRELRLKHPIFHLYLFKRQNFRVALLLFIIMGIFVPSTFQSAFTGGILQYEAQRNVELNLYLIPGILAGSTFCYYWYYQKYEPWILIVTGFLGFVIYHIILYNSFATDFAIHDFWTPSIIKGFAMVTLYISLGLYATQKMDIPTLIPAAGIVICVRSFLGSGVFAGLYNYFLYSQRIRHLDYLAGLTDENNFLVRQQGSFAAFYRNIQQQATLTASKEITGFIIITGIIVLISTTYLSICQLTRKGK